MQILNVDVDRLRQRASMKWSRYPADVLPLWVAEMDCETPPAVAEALQRAIALGDMGYPHGTGYEEAYAAFSADRWGVEVDPHRQIRLVPDVMQGIALAIRTCTEPGDGVVVNPPIYPPFYGVVRVTGRTVVESPLTEQGRLDLDDLEAVFSGERGAKPSAYLLCSPHNPNGTVHSRTELTQVAVLGERYGVRVIADEIHAPLASSHLPYTAVDPRGLVVTSASKSFSLAAVKAAVIVGGDSARDLVFGLPYELTRGSSSHLGLLANATAFNDDREWLDVLRGELASNRDLLTNLLGRHLPGIRYLATDGTYLAWLDCAELGLDQPAQHFLDRARVALNAGSDYGLAYPQSVRMNLATSPEIITEAVERMASSLA